MTDLDESHQQSFTTTVSHETETDEFGARLATVLEAGVVVALIGDLGAGKTRLVRAIAVGLGADESSVNSPTFVLMQRYEGRLPLYHFDTYRLKDAGEFEDLGPEEYFQSQGICFVEWADRVEDSLPIDHLRIEIDVVAETTRRFRIFATGPLSRKALRRLS